MITLNGFKFKILLNLTILAKIFVWIQSPLRLEFGKTNNSLKIEKQQENYNEHNFKL